MSKRNGKKDAISLEAGERVVLKPVKILERVHLGLAELSGMIKMHLPPKNPGEGTKPCVLVYIDDEVAEHLIGQLSAVVRGRWKRKNIGEGVRLTLPNVVLWIGSDAEMMRKLSEYHSELIRKQTVFTDQIFHLGTKRTDEEREIWRTFSSSCDTQVHFSFQSRIVVIDPKASRDLSVLRRSQVKLFKRKFRGLTKCKTLFLALSSALALLYLMSLVFGDSFEAQRRK